MTGPAAAAVSRARDLWIRRAPAVFIAWGVVVRVEQFASRRSLWLDEATLAINFVDRPFSQLAEPLGNGQGAPVGFLFVERAALAALGNNEYALRLFPLACGIASLIVFLRMARRLLPGAIVPVAAALVAFSPFLVYFSSEVKQYSVDVLAALVITDLGLRLVDRSRLRARDGLAFAVVGAAAIWLSHPATFVLAGTGIVLVVQRARRSASDVPILVAAGLACGASFGAAYLVSLRELAADEALRDYWRGAFFPRPFGTGTFRWLAATSRDFLINPGGFPLTILAAILIIAGAIALARRYGLARLAVLLAPVMFLLIAAAAKVYPARGRLVLFLVPVAALLIAASLTLVPPRPIPIVGALFAGAVIAVAASPVARVSEYLRRPVTRSETRPVFEYVKAGWRDGDVLYVHHGANSAFRYYGPMLGLRSAGVVRPLTREPCDDAAQLAPLRAAPRVWVVFGHRFAGAPAEEQAIIASHVEVVAQRTGVIQAPGAAAHLFDTSSPADPAGAAVLRDPALTCVELVSA